MNPYALGEGGGTKTLVAQHKKNHLFFCVFPNLLLSNSYIFDTILCFDKNYFSIRIWAW